MLQTAVTLTSYVSSKGTRNKQDDFQFDILYGNPQIDIL